MNPDEAVGKRIEDLRSSQGLSQGQLSDLVRAAGLNWSQGTVSRVEAGTRPVRFTEAFTVAKALGVEAIALTPAHSSLQYAYQRDLDTLDSARRHLLESEAQVDQAIAASQIMRLAIELSEGRQGPYIVHWLTHSLTRWLAHHLRTTTTDILKLLGIPDTVVNDQLTRVDEDLRSFELSGFDLDWDSPDYAPNFAEWFRIFTGQTGANSVQREIAGPIREHVLHRTKVHLQDGAITCLWRRYFPFVTEAPSAQGGLIAMLKNPAVEGVDVTEFDVHSTAPTLPVARLK